MKSTDLKGKTGIVARTHVGMVRQNNEDFHGYSTNLLEGDWHFYEESIVNSGEFPILLVVADGMGGLEMGEEASRIAIETTRDYMFEHISEIIDSPDSIGNHFVKMFALVNNEILDFASKHDKAGELGTTLIISFIADGKAHVFWIGDSRCYVIRKGKLKPVSKDHSYVQDLVDQGKISYEQSFFHPESNIVTKYMGDPRQTPVPSYATLTIEDGDVLLMCSDGLNGMLQDQEIEPHFYGQDDLSKICQSLIDAANAAGGHDNDTIILAAFDEFSKHIPDVITPAAVISPVSNEPFAQHHVVEPVSEDKKKKISFKAAILFFIIGCILTVVILYALNLVDIPFVGVDDTDSISEDSVELPVIPDDENILVPEEDKPSVEQTNEKPTTDKSTKENGGNEQPTVTLIQLDAYPAIKEILLNIKRTYDPASDAYKNTNKILNHKTEVSENTFEKGYKDVQQLKDLIAILLDYLKEDDLLKAELRAEYDKL